MKKLIGFVIVLAGIVGFLQVKILTPNSRAFPNKLAIYTTENAATVSAMRQALDRKGFATRYRIVPVKESTLMAQLKNPKGRSQVNLVTLSTEKLKMLQKQNGLFSQIKTVKEKRIGVPNYTVALPVTGVTDYGGHSFSIVHQNASLDQQADELVQILHQELKN